MDFATLSGWLTIVGLGAGFALMCFTFLFFKRVTIGEDLTRENMVLMLVLFVIAVSCTGTGAYLRNNQVEIEAAR